MGLSECEVRASVAVSDMAQAVEFYEGKLGLGGTADPYDDSRVYACGGGTSLHVYESAANAGKAPATLATWLVTDLVQVVDELRANGVTFEQYHDSQLETDERGSIRSAMAGLPGSAILTATPSLSNNDRITTTPAGHAA